MNNILKITVILPLVVLFVACGEGEKTSDKPTKETLKASIQEMDDSLKVLYKNVMTNAEDKVPSLAIYETINRHLAYYRAFPEDEYAATCLDKVHQLYMQEKAYENSIAYADTLLTQYKDYPKRAEVLLSIGSTYDVVLNDKEKVKKYYNQLLREFPKLNAETKEQITFRLKHIDKTFDEMIEMQMNVLTGK